jgi:hypothetical protein
MNVNQEHRAALTAAGLWTRFCDARNDLMTSGKTSQEAYDEALKICFPDGVPPPPPPPPPVVDPVAEAEKARKLKLLKNLKGKNGPGTGRPKSLPLVSHDKFGGREGGPVASILWVARNMDVADVKPEDCPDPMAWSLLRRCRKNATFAESFWSSMFPKVVPSKSTLTDDKPGEFDGARQVELIDKFRAVGLRIAGAERVAS